MKALAILLVLLVAFSVSGCAFIERVVSMTPEEHYFASLKVYEVTLDILIGLARAGYIDEEMHAKITECLIIADAGMAGMKVALLAKEYDSVAFKVALAKFVAALAKIDKLRELIEPVLGAPEGETS